MKILIAARGGGSGMAHRHRLRTEQKCVIAAGQDGACVVKGSGVLNTKKHVHAVVARTDAFSVSAGGGGCDIKGCYGSIPTTYNRERASELQ